MGKSITALEIKEGQKVQFKIDGEWKVEAKVQSIRLNEDNKVVIRASGWFLILGASEYCILID